MSLPVLTDVSLHRMVEYTRSWKIDDACWLRPSHDHESFSDSIRYLFSFIFFGNKAVFPLIAL